MQVKGNDQRHASDPQYIAYRTHTNLLLPWPVNKSLLQKPASKQG